MQLLFILIYFIPLFFIFTYSIIQFTLIINYLRSRKRIKVYPKLTEYPMVTVQLPVYNEKYVIERLLNAVIAFDYPADKFEIQVLDDSTDETTEIIQQKIEELKAAGSTVDLQLIRRPERTGFKAGALAYGLTIAKGEFIPIFDADFVPSPDFLKQTIPHFQNPKVGVVQTRWTHLNAEYSLLTKLQAFGLDAHFFIEQGGRNANEHYINFNGTAGVWRKTTIEDAGGWSADTLTEDLDLSYRAQMKKWEFVYREDIGSPAELPVAMNAIKSQQYRWMKGGAECFVKNARKLLNNSGVRGVDKFHGFFHLLNSSVFTAVLLLALLSILVMFMTINNPVLYNLFKWTAIFQINWLILGTFYWISFRYQGKSVAAFFWRFFWFLTFMMGLSLHNSIAVFEGWMGRKTPFVRTPKFGAGDWKKNSYVTKKIGAITWGEAALCLIFFGMFILDIIYLNYGMMIFHGMLTLGFGCVVYYTFKHLR
jgi:cellulose synthase/poly-beta-1,6-N-acetylglucosamine synthase-like glycosyltransferase